MPVNSNIFLGLDIGSHKVSALLCEIDHDNEIHIKGLGSSVTHGLSKGKISDEGDVFKAIEKAISRATHGSSSKPTKIVATIPSYNIQSVHNIGVLLSKEETGQISQSDLTECIRRSQNIVKSQNQTMVHAIPIACKVDGLAVKNPVGVFGKNIEIESHIVLADAESILLQSKLLKSLQLHIAGLVYNGIASAQFFLTQEERQSGAVLCDIGCDITHVSVYQDDILIDSAIIPIGGKTFSKDISECLKISLPEAERLKILHGDVILSRINSKNLITTLNKDNQKTDIKPLLLSQILEARLSELLQLIQKKIPNAFDPRLGLVLSGGGSELKGTAEYIEKKYTTHTRQGIPTNLKQYCDDPQYGTAIGLILYAVKTRAIAYHGRQRNILFKKVKKWIKSHF
jgi:cell division protein FtsA